MKVYTQTVPLEVPAVDAFSVLQSGFTDQFVFIDKQRSLQLMGLGRCIASSDIDELEYLSCGGLGRPPVFFSFNRFDEGGPQASNPLFEAFPHLSLMLPEVVLIHDADGDMLQVNSLGPLSKRRVDRFLGHIVDAPRHHGSPMAYEVTDEVSDSWTPLVEDALTRIASGSVEKVVLSREIHLRACDRFDSHDMLMNLIDNRSRGTVYLYRYDDVFLIGVTPELLVRKQGEDIESMCLAGSIGTGASEAERSELAGKLLEDRKNLREHAFVVKHLRAVFSRICHDVEIPEEPGIMALDGIQHLCTPLSARAFEDTRLMDLVREFHPTPALCGYPVGEAKAVLRAVEPYDRGFFGGPFGYMDGDGNGEFCVAIRCGVFDAYEGYIYAGCGIVQGSDPEEERRETDLKFRTILSAFEGVEE